MKVFGLGQGGKHRDTVAARRWRAATREMAAALLVENPAMGRDIAQLYAEDEVARELRAALRSVAR